MVFLGLSATLAWLNNVETDVKISGRSVSPDFALGRLPRPARLALAALLLAFALCLIVPWNLAIPLDDLDASWVVVLHWAQVHHAQFGPQIAFTYGPWGFATFFYLPQTFGRIVLTWTVLSVGMTMAIWKIFGKLRRWQSAILLMVLFTALAGAPELQFQDVRIAMFCWLPLLVYFYLDDSTWEPCIIILAVAMAWVGLIKFSATLMSLPALAVISVDQLSRRRIPSFLIAYLAAYLLLWIAAGQSLSNFGTYLSHSWTISSGYTEGEQEIVQTEGLDVSLYLAACGTLIVMLAMVHPWYRYRSENDPRRVLQEALVAAPGSLSIDHRKSLLGALGLLGVLFVLFKAGFVRHDLHEVDATGSIALIALAIASIVWPRVHDPLAKAAIIAICAGILTVTWRSEWDCLHQSVPGLALQSVEEVPTSIATAADWLTGSANIRQEYERHKRTLPPILAGKDVGPIDTYSIGQQALIDTDQNYDPRPVFQSYLTFSSALSKLNADFLASARAPQTILFGLEPIDLHYPTQDDALSIPEILTRYDPQDATWVRMMLSRSPTPRTFSLIPLGETSATIRHWVPVPDSDDPIWVKIHLNLLPWGSLVRDIYKLPVAGLAIKLPTGKELRYSLMRNQADSGFLLSPCMTDPVQLAVLYSPQWKSVLGTNRVKEMAVGFDDDDSDLYYQSQYSIEYFGLHYPHMDISAVPGVAQYTSIRSISSQITILHSDGDTRLMAIDDGKVVMMAPADTQIMFPAKPGAKTFRFGFGMLDSSYNTTPQTDGVQFVVLGLDRLQGSIRYHAIWSRILDPANVTDDRGLQHAEVQIPHDYSAGILLLTAHRLQHVNDDSYWTDLEFH
jgi:hypothetical protein